MDSGSQKGSDWHADLAELAEGRPFHVEAYSFVLGAMPESATGTCIDHVSADRICMQIHDHAIRLFGVLAREQLECWEVRSCGDLGIIVNALVDAGLVIQSRKHAVEKYQDGFEFDTSFQRVFQRQGAGLFGQWKLSTLFLVTTMVAIGLSGRGFGNGYGPVAALFFGWLVFVGLFCLVHGMRDRFQGRIAAVCIGLAAVGFGIAMWLGLVRF